MPGERGTGGIPGPKGDRVSNRLFLRITFLFGIIGHFIIQNISCRIWYRTFRGPDIVSSCMISVQQGDNGAKGPEGASGKDGSRVSSTFILDFTLFPSAEQKVKYLITSKLYSLSLMLSFSSGFVWSHWSSWPIRTQRCQGKNEQSCCWIIKEMIVS